MLDSPKSAPTQPPAMPGPRDYLLIFGVFLVFFSIALSTLYFLNIKKASVPPKTTNFSETVITPIDPSLISLEGEIVCLPHKDESEVMTLECAYGLYTKDNQYYGLDGLNQTDVISGNIAIGRRYKITGTLAPAKDSQYKISSTVMVSSIQSLDSLY